MSQKVKAIYRDGEHRDTRLGIKMPTIMAVNRGIVYLKRYPYNFQEAI